MNPSLDVTGDIALEDAASAMELLLLPGCDADRIWLCRAVASRLANSPTGENSPITPMMSPRLLSRVTAAFKSAYQVNIVDILLKKIYCLWYTFDVSQ